MPKLYADLYTPVAEQIGNDIIKPLYEEFAAQSRGKMKWEDWKNKIEQLNPVFKSVGSFTKQGIILQTKTQVTK